VILPFVCLSVCLSVCLLVCCFMDLIQITYVRRGTTPTSVTSCTPVGLSMLVAGDDSALSVCIELLRLNGREMPLPAVAGRETTDVDELLWPSPPIDDVMWTAIRSTGASLSRRISASVCLLGLPSLYFNASISYTTITVMHLYASNTIRVRVANIQVY